MQRKRMLTIVPLAVLLVAGALWASQRSRIQWVPVPEPRDRHATFFYERQLTSPQSVLQRRRVLVNHVERTERNEASMVYDIEFDCLTERHDTLSAQSTFKTNGEGEVIRKYVKEQLGMTGGLGIAAVRRVLCAEGLRDLQAQASYAVHMADFPLHSFLKCASRGHKDSRQHLERVRERVKPAEKKDGAFVYTARGQMGGYEINLPVSALEAGVCDAAGSTACGSASFLAMKVDWPLEVARDKLRNYRRSGIDYTVESRDPESGSTLRPVLVTHPNDAQASYLYCDSGNL